MAVVNIMANTSQTKIRIVTLCIRLLFEPVREKTNNMGSDQVRHKPGCTVTEDEYRLELFAVESREYCTICVAKTKALISFAVTANLICAFVFAYADCWFSHAAAHFISRCTNPTKRRLCAHWLNTRWSVFGDSSMASFEKMIP